MILASATIESKLCNTLEEVLEFVRRNTRIDTVCLSHITMYGEEGETITVGKNDHIRVHAYVQRCVGRDADDAGDADLREWDSFERASEMVGERVKEAHDAGLPNLAMLVQLRHEARWGHV